MKLRIWSDVHTEFGRLEWHGREDDKETVLVIAGDFMVLPTGYDSIDDLRKLCDQFKAVIYVAGNHEFYGSFYLEALEQLRGLGDEIPNLHFLDGDYAIIDNVRFVGGTLWTDFNDADEATMAIVRYSMNDYRKIYAREIGYKKVPISPHFIYARNQFYRGEFEKWLSTPFDGKTVVVSHHLPDVSFVNGYTDGDLVYAYGNTNMDRILNLPIDLWIHGHVHIRQEYVLPSKLKGIPVVANPRGYIGAQAMAYTFVDDKIWEI
jgi:hypothetical protein